MAKIKEMEPEEFNELDFDEQMDYVLKFAAQCADELDKTQREIYDTLGMCAWPAGDLEKDYFTNTPLEEINKHVGGKKGYEVDEDILKALVWLEKYSDMWDVLVGQFDETPDEE